MWCIVHGALPAAEDDARRLAFRTARTAVLGDAVLDADARLARLPPRDAEPAARGTKSIPMPVVGSCPGPRSVCSVTPKPKLPVALKLALGSAPGLDRAREYRRLLASYSNVHGDLLVLRIEKPRHVRRAFR